MRKGLTVALIVLLVVLAAAGAYGYRTWQQLQQPYKGYTGSEQFVEIPPGSGPGEIRRRLVDAGIVRDELTLRAALWWTGNARTLQAGEYRFDRPMSVVQVVNRIARGDVYTRRLTFPEGLTIDEMARLYESRGFGAAKEFVTAARNGSLVSDLDPTASDLEGYLFPETYSLARGTPALTLIAMMVDRFRENYGPSGGGPFKASGDPLSTREIVTLASLVEKETGNGNERALVAAVYLNRLKLGMAMQADPTVVYALQKAGKYDGNIRREDLAFDSPYNTYRYPGLPPGPIASPGKAALDAARAPADVPYLYFVSRNDGSHVFAETLAEHNANVYQYQILYFRQQRQRARQ